MKKESILDEEAYIYNHRDDENEGDKWKKMSKKQKLTYFNDYYRNKIIVILIVLGLIVSLIYTVLSPKPDVVVSIAVVNDYWNDDKTEELNKELFSYLALEAEKQEIEIDDTYFLEETGMGNEIANTQRLVAKFAAGDINIVIADRDKFDEFVKSDTFVKVSEVVDADVPYRDRLTSGGYGISLKDSKLMKELESGKSELVLGILANAAKEDYKYISKIINYILQKS
ncbi:MAG: hypothetical protein ACTTKY_04055 [Catonella sp.]